MQEWEDVIDEGSKDFRFWDFEYAAVSRDNFTMWVLEYSEIR